MEKKSNPQDPCRNQWCQNFKAGTEPYCSRCTGAVNAARGSVERMLGDAPKRRK